MFPLAQTRQVNEFSPVISAYLPRPHPYKINIQFYNSVRLTKINLGHAVLFQYTLQEHQKFQANAIFQTSLIQIL